MRFVALFSALALLPGFSSSGVDVNWGCTFFQTNVNSAGKPLDGAQLFVLGAFDVGFTPTPANAGDWAAHWHTAARVFYNPVVFNSFSGTYAVLSNSGPFATTQQGYIWGYNGAAANGEWLLMTNPAWKWPAVGGPQQPLSWVASGATVVIVGAVNGPGFHLKTQQVGDSPLPPLTPAEWRNLRFTPGEQGDPAMGAWGADPDRDGLSNTLEYSFGCDPRDSISVFRLQPEIMNLTGQDYLKLAIPKCGYSSAVLSVEAGGYLFAWSSAPSVVEVLMNTAQRLEARDLTPFSGASHRFLRVRVTFPP